MKKVIWLDDLRNPEERVNQTTISAYVFEENDVIWVKTYDQFVKHIREFGSPDFMFLDHDLSPEHYTPRVYWNSYAESYKYQCNRPTQNKTGYDAAVWLVNYCKTMGVGLPDFYSQSANPIGRDKIICMLNWEKDNSF